MKPYGHSFFQWRVVNGDDYLETLQNYFIHKLNQLELAEDTVFQQDGAPCHFALKVKQNSLTGGLEEVSYYLGLNNHQN